MIVEQILVKKKTKITTRPIYENFPSRKLKNLNFPEKPDSTLKKQGSFFGKIFATLYHSMTNRL